MSEKTQDQPVFEEIEKKMKYGAPELQRLYKKFVTRGLIFAVILHLVLVSGYVFALYLDKVRAEREKSDMQKREITLEELDIPPPIEDVPIEEPKAVALKDLSALVPEPVAKKEIKKDVFQQFEVEKAPVAVNLGAVKGSMRYPEIARQSGIEGRVVAKVLVGTDGSVIKVGGISGPEVFRDEVADKVMNLSFTPALQNGQPVKCWVSVPFSFSLGGKKKAADEDKEEESGE